MLKGSLELAAGTDAEYLALGDGSRLLNASTMLHSARVIAKIASIEPGKGLSPTADSNATSPAPSSLGTVPYRSTPGLTAPSQSGKLPASRDFPTLTSSAAHEPSSLCRVANAVPPPVAAAVARTS